jgi:hypothetical protein
MIRRTFLLVLLPVLIPAFSAGQEFVRTSDLFPGHTGQNGAGTLTIKQNAAVDTLISRHILANKRLDGMEGFRIQIYYSNNRNAREESNKVRAEFLSKFPDIPSEIQFADPGYFIVRAGNYRTRFEGTKYLNMVRKVFPEAYLVPDVISFPKPPGN